MTVPLTRRAVRQVQALAGHYRRRERPDAIQNLAAAVAAAQEALPAQYRRVPAPRPYPELSAPGVFWTRHGRYWFRYRITPASITAVYYDAADIPART